MIQQYFRKVQNKITINITQDIPLISFTPSAYNCRIIGNPYVISVTQSRTRIVIRDIKSCVTQIIVLTPKIKEGLIWVICQHMSHTGIL